MGTKDRGMMPMHVGFGHGETGISKNEPVEKGRTIKVSTETVL
jgi:hypothetical protein